MNLFTSNLLFPWTHTPNLLPQDAAQRVKLETVDGTDSSRGDLILLLIQVNLLILLILSLLLHETGSSSNPISQYSQKTRELCTDSYPLPLPFSLLSPSPLQPFPRGCI
jgi:hypothetical protein